MLYYANHLQENWSVTIFPGNGHGGSLGAKDSYSVGGKAIVYYRNCGDGLRGWCYTYQN